MTARYRGAGSEFRRLQAGEHSCKTSWMILKVAAFMVLSVIGGSETSLADDLRNCGRYLAVSRAR
jgi:hypothetical protein